MLNVEVHGEIKYMRPKATTGFSPKEAYKNINN